MFKEIWNWKPLKFLGIGWLKKSKEVGQEVWAQGAISALRRHHTRPYTHYDWNIRSEHQVIFHRVIYALGIPPFLLVLPTYIELDNKTPTSSHQHAECHCALVGSHLVWSPREVTELIFLTNNYRNTRNTKPSFPISVSNQCFLEVECCLIWMKCFTIVSRKSIVA